MSKSFVEPRWFYDNSTAHMCYWPGGELNPGVQIPLDKCKAISRMELQILLPFLFEQGFLNTFLTKQSRDEDLKIIHRLFDVVEAKT